MDEIGRKMIFVILVEEQNNQQKRREESLVEECSRIYVESMCKNVSYLDKIVCKYFLERTLVKVQK